MREYSPILGPVDSAFYYVERPETPMNIGALTLFEGLIDFDELVKHIDSRLHRIPRYLDRVMQAPFNIGAPTWIPDPHFYIENHVKRATVQPPGTVAELRKLTGDLLSRTLPRDRPLWEVYMIDGLKDQTALFFKVHHCMVDGLAAVELFTFLMDVSPEYTSMPAEDKPKPLFDPPELPDPVELTVDSLMRDLSHQVSMVQKLGREALRMGSMFTDRDKRLKMLLAGAHLLNNNLQPIQKLPINGQNTGRQTMVWAEFPLDEIHAIRAQCGASVNDVMLALMTKAVERYTYDNGGTSQPFLRALVPFNVRDETEKGEYGNRISVLPIDIPFNIDDPIEHLKAVTRFTKVMKESSLAYSMDLLLTLPALLPSVTHLPIWNMAPVAFSLLAHTWCTNVAATPIPVYLLGHEMKHVYGYFPLNPSMGLATVIVSYNGRITISLIADQGIIKNAESLERYLKDAYYDLASGLPERKEPPPPAAIIPETLVVPASEVVSQNGHAPEPVAAASVAVARAVPPAAVAAEPLEQPAPILMKERYPLFSNGWALALQEEVNHSEDYRSVSMNWTAGSLAFIMEAAPEHGFETPAAVWLDLYRGVCRSARALSPQEALREATFVIQGAHAAWMDALHGRAAPLVMLTNGRLKLKKGALLRLLPHTRSAGELVRCAQRVS
jgi:WS/DGAT/MGAT family acyltransferase